MLQHLLEESSDFPLLEGFEVFQAVMNIEALLKDGQAIVLPAQLLQAAWCQAQSVSGFLGGQKPGGHISLVLSVMSA
jgi:hypothetical protein